MTDRPFELRVVRRGEADYGLALYQRPAANRDHAEGNGHWPLGIAETALYPAIGLVEGTPDFLALIDPSKERQRRKFSKLGGDLNLTAKITERRGGLVGALVISPEDELFAITSNGGVIRTPVKPVRRTRDRNTMGVKLMDLPEGVTIVALARNADEPDEQD